MIIRVADTETTGLKPPPDDAVVEIATVDLVPTEAPTRWVRGRTWSSLVNPGRPIPPEAMAVHHITDEMVKDAPIWEEVRGRVTAPVGDHNASDGNMVFAAHNNRFDMQFMDFGARWIDTYRVALKCWPQCPSHKNQVLRYWLGLKLADPTLAQPHRAPGDAYVTAAILARVFMEFDVTVDDLVKWSAEPALLPRLTFGEHAMKPIAEVPTSYFEWVVKKFKPGTDDEDVIHTAKHQLYIRREASRARAPATNAKPPGQ